VRIRLLLAATVLGGLTAAPLALAAGPVPSPPPACVVVDQAPLHAQVGYAPNGPSDCTTLP
jgi:hypothetical protein